MNDHDHDDEQMPIAIPLGQLKSMATDVAAELRHAGEGTLPPELRSRFITVRAALFQRGIYDPVLVRYDTASAPRASHQELGEQLATVAEALTT